MMFFRKALNSGAPAETVSSGDETAGPGKEPTALDVGKWYLNQALQFEKSKQQSQARLTQLAVRGFVGAMVVAVASIVGSSALVLLKRPNPPAVLRDNTATGQVDVLNVASDGHMTFGEKEDRADLHRYVESRESYDWETIQDMFNTVKLMSAQQERDEYVKLFALPNAPQKVLKDQYRIIARVGAIAFVGDTAAGAPERTAQVYFSRKLIPLGSGREPKTEYWIATMHYRHEKLPEKRSELDVNPTGFRVTSYTVDRDWTRAPDPATTAAAGAASVVAPSLVVAPAAPARGTAQ